MATGFGLDDIIVLALAAAAIWYFFIRKPSSKPSAAEEAGSSESNSAPRSYAEIPCSNLREFTLEELRYYDGKEGRPIYIAICNRVVDASSGAHLYGPGGQYENFAGRDISRAAGKFSTELKYLDDPDISGLSSAEIDSMRTFYNMLGSKYPPVGRLVKTKSKDQVAAPAAQTKSD